MSRMGVVELLERVWESAPGGIDEEAYVQLLIGCIQHGSRISSVSEIESHVPASEQLPSLTTIKSVPAILSIEQHRQQVGPEEWISSGTEVVLGPVAERLRELGADQLDPRAVAEAARVLIESGDVGVVESLFSNAESSTHHAQPPATPAGTAEAGPPPTGKPPGPGDQTTRRPGNEVNQNLEGGLFATPPKSRLSGYRGRFEVDVAAIDRRTACTPRRTACTPNGGSGRDRRPLERLEIGKERELLQRNPIGGEVPRVSFPTEEVYERIIEWRPILKWAEPLASMLQLILISDRRDDRFDPDLPCTGMPLWHELVLAAFGFPSRQHAQKHGVNSGMLIELFRKYIDSDFHVSGWNKEEDRARVVLRHSIPSSIIEAVEEHMLGPEEPDDKTYLIGGRSANRRNEENDQYEQRVRMVEEQEPEIQLPEFTKRMQEYLNGLKRQSFAHGGYGFVAANIDSAFESAREQFKDAQRRRQVLRKLCMVRQYPKPLYPACDFFPRLKAEGHNQLMNLPSYILRPIYTDRDRELDLSKAHLACETPVAEKNGIDATLLREYLERNSQDEEFDLWMDVAEHFNVEDPKAARKAAKSLYGAAYGSSEQNVIKEMCWAYADAGGAQHSFEPFKPALEHPLVDELFRMRGELRELIQQRGYLVDAAGRKIRPEMMTHKDEGDKWKSVLAYVNASFEQKLMSQIFDLAIEEQQRERPRFTIWLYQSDGVTVRVKSRASVSHQVQRLQEAVKEKADELGVPTRLEVDWSA